MQGRLISVSLIISIAGVYGQDQLPPPGECGVLNPDYMFNQKNVTELDEFPWMGRIAYTETGTDTSTLVYRCLAVLISKRSMLTNAYCLHPEHDVRGVLLGDWNPWNDSKEADCDDNGKCAPVPRYYDIEDVIIHRDYNSKTRTNDIAMLRLNESVTYTDYIRPICLPSADVAKLDFVSQHLQLTGWYKEGIKVKKGSKVKYFAHVVGLRQCGKLYENGKSIFEGNSHMCAYTCISNSIVDSDVFLSGSPLMGVTMVNTEPTSYYLIALISYGRIYCTSAYPDIFSRIDFQLDWIKENIY